MIPAQERLISGFSELKKFTQDTLTQIKLPAHPPTLGNTFNADRKSKPITKIPPPELIEKMHITSSLRNYIDHADAFAAYSVIMGRCDDNLPLTLELTNPAPGSILISGDSGSGKLRQLIGILKSAVLLNTPEQLNIHIITDNPGEFEELSQTSICQNVLSHQDWRAEKTLRTLFEQTEQRRREVPGDPAVILAIDDFSSLPIKQDRDMTALLFRLFKHGPRSRIWTLASIPSHKFQEVHPRLLDAFRTRLIGKIASVRMASEITQDSTSPAINLHNGTQFCIPVNDNWLKFSVCD